MLGVHLIAADFTELLEKFLLALVEVLRREHLDDHMLVTASIAAQVRNAALTQAQDFPGLCAGRNLDFHRAIDSRYLYLVAQSSLHKGYRHFHNDIVTFTPENLMRFDENIYVEVAIAAATYTSLTAAAYAHARTIVHAFRDIDLDFARNLLVPCTMTVTTGILDDFARAMTASAGRLIDHASKGRIGHRLPRACTITIRAGFGTGTGLCPRAMAVVTLLCTGNIEFSLLAKGCLFKSNFQIIAQVAAPFRPGLQKML